MVQNDVRAVQQSKVCHSFTALENLRPYAAKIFQGCGEGSEGAIEIA
jgi:hypothetical protein